MQAIYSEPKLGRSGQNVLKLYHLYRLIIGLSLVLLISSNLESHLMEVLQIKSFLYASWTYLIVNILIVLLLPRTSRMTVLFSLALLDVLLLNFLFYTAGGPASGIGNLIIVAVAVANILLNRHLGLVLAAVAAAGIIYLTFYLSFNYPAVSNQFMQAGISGALCFAAAFFIQLVTRRLKDSESLALEQASTVANLETLNALVIERMRTGIIITDLDYKVLQANQSAAAMLNTSELQGRNLTLQFPALVESYNIWEQNPTMLPPAVQFSEKSPQLQPNFTLLNKIRTNKQLLIFLEDTRQINQHAQHLKLLSLGRLAAAISHEIRNPLGAISHAAQLLGESANLDKADQRLGQIIQDQAERMNMVVENVLQLSKQQRSAPQLLELRQWLEEFADSYSETAPAENTLKLEIKGETHRTRMDPLQLGQVLTNLISNAMRYTPLVEEKRVVELNLFKHPYRELPVLEILDEGPVIPESEQQSMFEPFFTTDSKGTGLGLYISRELCEANQARLDYYQREQQGSCFRITFAHPKTYGTRP